MPFFFLFRLQRRRGNVALKKTCEFIVRSRGGDDFGMELFMRELGFAAFFILFARPTRAGIISSGFGLLHLFSVKSSFGTRF